MVLKGRGEDSDALRVSVWRGGDEGGFNEYRVPRQANQTVLDVVTHIQRHLEPTLSYRYACRVGMCGSCAMTVNGVARWTCRTHVAKVADGSGALEIAPLANLPVIKDLACDMSEFFDKWARAKGAFEGSRTRHDDFATVAPASAERVAADAGIECIGCGVCHASCDVVAWRPEFLGPAALNRAWTLVNDVRDEAGIERLARRGRRRRLSCVPYPRQLQRALPQADRADGGHRRPEAPRRTRGGQGLVVTSDAALQAAADEARRWWWQRISAMVLAVCVVVHLAVMIYAVRGGLSGAEILARTRGSWSFAAVYAVFVVACAVHVTPGLNNIAVEWLGFAKARAWLVARAFGVLVLVAGWSAVYAVVAA